MVGLNQKDIAIVGAGITGLVLAWRLERLGKKVVLLEQGSYPGGAVRTRPLGSYLLEVGPNTVLGKKSLLSLVRDLGLDERLQRPEKCASKRFIALPGKTGLKLHAVPMSLLSALASPLVPWSIPFQLGRELFLRPSAAQDLDVSSFMARHLGPHVRDYLVAPALSGIWAADISSLSVRSALPRLWEFEQNKGSLIRGALSSLWQKSRKPQVPKSKREKTRMISFPSGLMELPQALANQLNPGTLHLNSRLKTLTIESGQATLITELLATEDIIPGQEETIKAEKVIITADALTSAQLLSDQYPDLARQISCVPYAPVGVIHYVVDEEALQVPANGFGFLIPPHLGKALLGVIFSSSIFSGRAPAGKVLLTCFCGGAVRPSLADVEKPEVLAQVLKEVDQALGVSLRGEVLDHRYYPRAIPNYSIGHFRLQEQLALLSRETGVLYFSANWLSGIGIADRVEHAEDLVRNLC